MNTSPYLKRRLRTLDEVLKAKGKDTVLRVQGGDVIRRTSRNAEASDAAQDRARLTLVSSEAKSRQAD